MKGPNVSFILYGMLQKSKQSLSMNIIKKCTFIRHQWRHNMKSSKGILIAFQEKKTDSINIDWTKTYL